jgi:hypothetical protein
VDSAATDTLDAALGEEELPPFPPTGVFDARFVGDDINLPRLGQGTYKDYRANNLLLDSTMVFELKYQVGNGSNIKIKWSWPEGASGILQDFFGGVAVNKEMHGKDSLVIDNPSALNKLKMIATISSTVPVELTHFRAKVVRDIVALTWRTESESNNLGFEIQKSSDGFDFECIGFVSGAGTSTVPNDYAFQDSELTSGTIYYRLKQMDTDGAFVLSEPVCVTIAPPHAFELQQNYPNPFNPSTTIRYMLSTSAHVNVSILSLNGKIVEILVDESQTAGTYELPWQGNNLASGTFLCRMQADDYVEVKKMLLIR